MLREIFILVYSIVYIILRLKKSGLKCNDYYFGLAMVLILFLSSTTESGAIIFLLRKCVRIIKEMYLAQWVAEAS